MTKRERTPCGVRLDTLVSCPPQKRNGMSVPARAVEAATVTSRNPFVNRPLEGVGFSISLPKPSTSLSTGCGELVVLGLGRG